MHELLQIVCFIGFTHLNNLRIRGTGTLERFQHLQRLKTVLLGLWICELCDGVIKSST
jgi:hypothetical protein